MPKDIFIVTGFDVQGRIAKDGDVQKFVQFVLFTKKNVSYPRKIEYNSYNVTFVIINKQKQICFPNTRVLTATSVS